jgi:septal ring factor EnvC (AmiA/AmiB activator)
MANGNIQVSDHQVNVEEIFFSMIMYLLKKPKGLFILFSLVGIFVVVMYFSFMKAQNAMMIDSFKVLQSTAQVSDTIQKKVKEIETKAEQASKEIDDRIAKLDEVEQRFKQKREEIQRLREKQDALLKELDEKLQVANQKLDMIDNQQIKQQQSYEIMQKSLKGGERGGIPRR